MMDIGGRTRLVTRLRILCRWDRPVDALMSLVLNEFGDFPMMRKMLRTLRQRAEAGSLLAHASGGGAAFS
jgi:hypothetical protein